MKHIQGSTATIVLSNGDIYSGLFFGASLEVAEPEYLLKMVRFLGKEGKTERNGIRDDQAGYIGVGEDNSMSFKLKDVADLSLEQVSLGSLDKRANGISIGSS